VNVVPETLLTVTSSEPSIKTRKSPEVGKPEAEVTEMVVSVAVAEADNVVEAPFFHRSIRKGCVTIMASKKIQNPVPRPLACDLRPGDPHPCAA